MLIELPGNARAVVEFFHIFLLRRMSVQTTLMLVNRLTESKLSSVAICCRRRNLSLTSPNAVWDDRYAVTALRSRSKRIAPSLGGMSTDIPVRW